jgi:hypothetical protein
LHFRFYAALISFPWTDIIEEEALQDHTASTFSAEW